MVTAERPKSDVAESTSIPENWEAAPHLFPLRLQLPVEWELTDEQLLELSSLNEEWHLEADCDGGLLMAPPPGPLSGKRELLLASQILSWSDAANQGETFPSVTFRLPNGWRRAPDAAWIGDERLDDIAVDDEGIWAVCPDFVIEVRSVSDKLDDQREKMEMWIAQGARLGWLVDPFNTTVWVYRPEQEAEQVQRPESLTATEIAEDLKIDFTRIWPQPDREPESS